MATRPTEMPALAEELGADSVVSAVTTRRTDAPAMPRSADALAGQRSQDCAASGRRTPSNPGTVRKGDGDPYAVFTPFSKVWRRTGWHGPVPSRPMTTFDGSVPVRGGRLATRCPTARTRAVCSQRRARRRRSTGGVAFVDSTGAADGTMRSGVDAYDDLRDRPALNGTSHLSPDLKWGTIHPRTLLADLDASGSGSAGTPCSRASWRGGTSTPTCSSTSRAPRGRTSTRS